MDSSNLTDCVCEYWLSIIEEIQDLDRQFERSVSLYKSGTLTETEKEAFLRTAERLDAFKTRYLKELRRLDDIEDSK